MPDAAVEAPPETTAPPQSTDGSMTDTDAYAALDAMVETPATPQASAATEKIDTNHPEQKPKPEVKAPKDTVKPEVKEPVNEPVKPAETQKPVKAKTLAEAKEMAQAEAKEWRQKYEALQKEAAKAKDDPEKKTLAERLAEREKRLADIEEELKYTNFEKTEEFKDRYQKPFLTAYEKGRKFVSQLQVVERKEQFDVEGETRERVLQPGRQATAADFDAVMRLYNFNPAEGSKLATQLFGEMAPDVKDYIRDTQRLYEAQESAKEEFRAKGSEREKAMGETHKRMTEEVTSAFNQALEMGPKKWPDRYGPKEGDAK
jgi:exonuclease VII large subunit